MSGLRMPRTARDDGGFTLAELIVAMAVLSIILIAAGGLMFSTTITQRSVSAVTQSTSSAQSAADAIRVQLRNAAEFELFPRGVADQLLVARVASTGEKATYTCRGWYYAADDHELRTGTWPVEASTALPASASGVSGWTLLVDGISPSTGSAVFQPPVGGTIEVVFEVESDDRNEPTAIQFTAVGGQEEDDTCWA